MQLYVDGALLLRVAAKISTFNHGLAYGDGVFERIRIYDRRIRLDPTTMRPARRTIASHHEAIRQVPAAQPARTFEHIQRGAPMKLVTPAGGRLSAEAPPHAEGSRSRFDWTV
jgi:hypothetical protein